MGSLQTCVWPCTVILKQNLCWILVRSNSFEMLPMFCQHPNVGIRVVSPLGNASTRITPSQSQKAAMLTLSADGDFLNFFFWGDWGWCHYMDCLFLSDSKWWTQTSSIVTIQNKKVSCSASKHPINSLILSSTLRLQGIPLVHTFKHPRSRMI